MENLKEESRVDKQKIMIKVLNILQQKSSRAIDEAKNQILAEKIESKRARKALEYYVKNWNDTTHPGILALACEAVGGNIVKAVPMQVVMLYLTAAMDLHDDVVDQSKVKNGKPTVFGKYGKDISLLLGNAMMINGFTLLCDCGKELTSEAFRTVTRIIQTSLFDIGNAHLLETDLKGEVDIKPMRYLTILEKKASIIETHTKIGAIIGGGSLDEIKALTRYGKILGMLISIREEFIDVFEPKELQNRMRNEILPLPLLYAFKNSGVKSELLNILSKPKVSDADADKVIECIFQDKNVKKLNDYMETLAEEATKIILSTVKDKQAIENLSLLIKGSLEDI